MEDVQRCAYAYPHKKPRYRQVIFTNQGARYRNGILVLPGGQAGRFDVVGSTNIRTIGIDGAMRPGCNVPNVLHWSHPAKYPATSVAGSPSDTGQVAREPSREATGL